jgi:hypothetical protein
MRLSIVGCDSDVGIDMDRLIPIAGKSMTIDGAPKHRMATSRQERSPGRPYRL